MHDLRDRTGLGGQVRTGSLLGGSENGSVWGSGVPWMVSYFQALIGLVGLGCSTLLTAGLISDRGPQPAHPALVPVGHLSIDRDPASPPQTSDDVLEPAPSVPPTEWAADPYASREAPAAGPQGEVHSGAGEQRRAVNRERGSSQRTLKRVCRVTAYCDRGITASGVDSGVGQCAAPADIPFGSKIYVPKLNRTFLVTDRTHKRFRKSTVDLFMPGKTQCLEFGRHYLDVVITLPDKPWKRPQGR
jgi:3D (Asp-Asp-Asp) domain-containing protein